MIRTPVCDVFGIELPIILAPMGSCTSGEFAAAVSNAGGLGSIGTLSRTADAVKRDIDAVRKLTQRPFAINHIPQTLDAEAFRYSLEARPAVISFALADPGDLVRQAHDVGARVMVQVTTVAQAVRAAERGADVINAQGGESGGYGGLVSAMALVPQVVDAVSPLPVVASGGIFDGRGIAAALMLGALGVNLGTRFIASKEAPATIEWKQAIISAQSEDAIKADVFNDIRSLPGTAGYGTVVRSLRTPFLDEWSSKREEALRDGDRLRGQIVSASQTGRQHEYLLTAGQTAGGIKEILPVSEIISRLMAETEVALSRATTRGERTRYETGKLRHGGYPRTSDAPIPHEILEPDSLGG
ncbi:MAG TPA: nitronate monooxygenase [Xanthobacteraceae bacterium]|jgi:nitronate monooxygenase/enoyl-[acyl-carrier protein] reductase II|nr:nitronate monooxygenase [Xanthobacteraceae bacterium]